MPTSEKRIAANRANALKSTGPTTAIGKRNSARNGTRHGILANTILIDHESSDRFAALLNAIAADFQPVGATERMLVEKMAVCKWRQFRIWAVEKAAIIHETRRLSGSETAETSDGVHANDDAATRTMLAIRALGETDRHPDLLGRYEHRYDRQYHRPLEALQRIQKGRKPQSRESDAEVATDHQEVAK